MFTLENLGFSLVQVPTRDRSIAYRIDTPFKITEGAPLEIYAQLLEGQVRFFDDGLNLHTLLSLGVCFNDDHKWKSLQNIFSERGIQLHPSGSIETYTTFENATTAFSNLLRSLLKLESWITNEALKPKKNKRRIYWSIYLRLPKDIPSSKKLYNPLA